MSAITRARPSWTAFLLLPDGVRAKLERFSQFGDGWAFGEGKRFGRNNIAAASILAATGQVTHAFDGMDVFPGRHGQIIVTLYSGDDSHEFTVAEDAKTVTYCHESDGEEGDERSFLLPDAIHFILKFGPQTCRLFESLSQMSTKQGSVVLEAKRLSHTKTVEAYQFSMQSAPLRSPPVYVVTHEGSTLRHFQPRQPSFTFGVSILPSSPQGTSWNRHSAIPVTTATEMFSD